LADRVEARLPGGRRLVDLEALLSSAVRLDFQSDQAQGIRPLRVPVRPVSDAIPIDYQGFRKLVSFSSGTLFGTGRTVARNHLRRLLAVRRRGDPSEMRRAFESLTGTSDHSREADALMPLVENFFRSLRAAVVRRWLPGYRIRVRIAGQHIQLGLNGRLPAWEVPSGARIDFRVDPHSTIPHYPSGNPHVLEHPPMA
jgi:hypothetical protein